MNTLPLNLLTFPLWWYTTGTGLVWAWAKLQAIFGLRKTGLLLFARHWKEPLYGDYTKAGIIFSFFLRIFILLYKLLMFIIRVVIITVMVIAYLLLLPFCLVMIFMQLMPV
jgi:hypothetical protein